MSDPYKNATTQLEEVSKILKLDKKTVDALSKPDNFFETELEVKMDGGKTRKFQAYRSQHNNARGPYKGGIRFHPNVSSGEVKALSMWMTWKCSVVGIPYGGGKGGVIVDPRELSLPELERLSRAYASWASSFISPWRDIPAPDVNTNGQIMAWMIDELEKSDKAEMGLQNMRATITGKPVEIGGSLGREEATGMGGFYTLLNLTEHRKWKIGEVDIAVQGVGNVGYWFAKLASDHGYRIVSLSDSRGAIYKKEGIGVDGAMEYKSKNGSLSGYPGSTDMTNEELLELDVTVLAPAALENVINEENAGNVKAKAIIELANGPVTPQADKILHERGTTSVPDVLSNAGGVTVSYFEWVQNLHGYRWEREDVFLKLKTIMDASYREIKEMHESLGDKFNMRMAAYAVSVSKVVGAMKLLGRV